MSLEAIRNNPQVSISQFIFGGVFFCQNKLVDEVKFYC